MYSESAVRNMYATAGSYCATETEMMTGDGAANHSESAAFDEDSAGVRCVIDASAGDGGAVEGEGGGVDMDDRMVAASGEGEVAGEGDVGA